MKKQSKCYNKRICPTLLLYRQILLNLSFPIVMLFAVTVHATMLYIKVTCLIALIKYLITVY